MHGGVEIAASPWRAIDTGGPLPVVADVGNNNGFILGPRIENWRQRDWADLAVSMQENGAAAVTGTGADLPATPLACMVFLAGHLAERGRTLKAGDMVTTGNVAGAWRPEIGSILRYEFADAGWIEIEVAEETPQG